LGPGSTENLSEKMIRRVVEKPNGSRYRGGLALGTPTRQETEGLTMKESALNQKTLIKMEGGNDGSK